MFDQRAYMKVYRATHAAQWRTERKRYNAAHSAEIAKYNSEYYMMHRDKMISRALRSIKERVAEVAAYARRHSGPYSKKRYHTDPYYRLRNILRARMSVILRGKVRKSTSTEILLGAPFDTCKAWIESQFQSGMSWANHGKWEIHHKKPCYTFDLTDPAQQRACFHYTNLQPLWYEDHPRGGPRALSRSV